MQSEAIDLRYDETNYLIVPHSAILALVRGDAPPEEPSDTTIEDLEDLWDEE